MGTGGSSGHRETWVDSGRALTVELTVVEMDRMGKTGELDQPSLGWIVVPFAKMRGGEQVLFYLFLEVRKMDSFSDLLAIPAEHPCRAARGTWGKVRTRDMNLGSLGSRRCIKPWDRVRPLKRANR